ncbi:MRC [Mytilus coruscus]|uniref:MRC n=1 Tax=Mytilus coruscus TaxID=42192 RepID=A0A6J8CZW5_MYTCO|nr:MRC [Mytilus coruscus]
MSSEKEEGRHAGRLLIFAYKNLRYSSVNGQVCPPGWVDGPMGKKCYLFADNHQRNWFEAKYVCNSMRAQLLSIENSLEMAWIKQELTKVKAKTTGTSEWWTSLQKNGTVWNWSSNIALDNTVVRWGLGEPNIHPNKEICAEICCPHFLNGINCEKRINYICELDKEKYPLTCDADNGWEYHQGSCYKFVQKFKTWNESASDCKDLDSNLAAAANIGSLHAVSTIASFQQFDSWVGVLRKNKTYFYTNSSEAIGIDRYIQPSKTSELRDEGGAFIVIVYTRSRKYHAFLHISMLLTNQLTLETGELLASNLQTPNDSSCQLNIFLISTYISELLFPHVTHVLLFCGSGISMLNEEKRTIFFNKHQQHIQEEYNECIDTALLEEIASYEDLDSIDIMSDAHHGWRKNAKDTSVVAIGEKTHKVLNCEHVTKAHDIVSQGHEKVETVRVYQYMKDKDVRVGVRCHDGNLSIKIEEIETLNQNNTWHCVKAMKTAMKKISSGPQYSKKAKRGLFG